MVDASTLDSHHKATVEHLFRHPTSHNIEWHDVTSLLGHLGETTEDHDKLKVSVEGETLVLHRPRHGTLDTQQVVDLRHLLERVGLTPDAIANG